MATKHRTITVTNALAVRADLPGDTDSVSGRSMTVFNKAGSTVDYGQSDVANTGAREGTPIAVAEKWAFDLYDTDGVWLIAVGADATVIVTMFGV